MKILSKNVNELQMRKIQKKNKKKKSKMHYALSKKENRKRRKSIVEHQKIERSSLPMSMKQRRLQNKK